MKFFALRFGGRALPAALLAALPLLAAQAQNPHQDSLLRRGDLVGQRRRPAPVRTLGPAPAPGGRPTSLAADSSSETEFRARRTGADPGLLRFVQEEIKLDQAGAADMPGLYGKFIDFTRQHRRKWNAKDWAQASGTLSRLNQRYEQVRETLPLEERLRIRSWQGEFRTLENARKVKDKVSR